MRLGQIIDLPGVSFIWYVFLNSAPPGCGNSEDITAAVESLLNTLAFVSALILTVIMAIPMSLDYDEMEAADERCVLLLLHAGMTPNFVAGTNLGQFLG